MFIRVKHQQCKVVLLAKTVWELWPAQDFGINGDKYTISI